MCVCVCTLPLVERSVLVLYMYMYIHCVCACVYMYVYVCTLPHSASENGREPLRVKVVPKSRAKIGFMNPTQSQEAGERSYQYT